MQQFFTQDHFAATVQCLPGDVRQNQPRRDPVRNFETIVRLGLAEGKYRTAIRFSFYECGLSICVARSVSVSEEKYNAAQTVRVDIRLDVRQ